MKMYGWDSRSKERYTMCLDMFYIFMPLPRLFASSACNLFAHAQNAEIRQELSVILCLNGYISCYDLSYLLLR
jgi:hypothetical protein